MKNLPYTFLNLLVAFLATFGCGTYCLPAFVPFFLAALVAARVLFGRLLIALAGRYLSPVAFGPCVEGLPDAVRHFCLPHDDKDF
jgi:hypothetical protein